MSWPRDVDGPVWPRDEPRAPMDATEVALRAEVSRLTAALAESEQQRDMLTGKADDYWKAKAVAESESAALRERLSAVTAERDEARARIGLLQRDKDQHDRDWNAMLLLVATAAGEEDPQAAAEDDYDPWAAIRQMGERLQAEGAARERVKKLKGALEQIAVGMCHQQAVRDDDLTCLDLIPGYREPLPLEACCVVCRARAALAEPSRGGGAHG